MNPTRPDPQLRIRDAHPDDTTVLLSMIRALAAHHQDVPDINAAALRRDVFGKPPWVHVLVAETKGKVIGYTVLSPLSQLQLGRRGIDMHHLFVERCHRGMGVGRRLIKGAIDKARALSCSYMMVGTHPDNSQAQATYLACGFTRRDAVHPRFHLALDA